MFVRKNRISKYTIRLSSPRISPTNSISDIEWNNEQEKNHKTSGGFLSKKTKYTSIAIGCSTMITIIIVIAVVMSTITKSTSSTTNSTSPTPSVAAMMSVTVTSTSLISTILSTTTSTISIISTNTQSTSTSITTGTTTISQSVSSSITSQTTSTSTSTTSKTTTSTESTSTSTTSETTTSTESTSTSTTSETTTSSISTSTTMSTLRWNTSAITVAGVLNANNATPNYLKNPKGLAIDSSGTLYVADTDNHRAQQFLLGSPSGTTIAGNETGFSGNAATYLTYPVDIAVDSNSNVYVLDTYNSRVQLWKVNATSGITVAGTGGTGGSLTQLNFPRGISFDLNTNTFYVSDTANNRVMKYTLNSTVGVLVAGGNGAGLNSTQLSSPRGLYFDSTTNSLFIANYGANNIVRWVIGASNWSLVAGSASGISGNNSTALNSPSDVILDPMGNVYVADTSNYRVQFFRAGEFNGTTIAGVTSSPGTNSIKISQPYSIVLDNQLNLYVADSGNERIQKFMRY